VTTDLTPILTSTTYPPAKIAGYRVLMIHDYKNRMIYDQNTNDLANLQTLLRYNTFDGKPSWPKGMSSRIFITIDDSGGLLRHEFDLYNMIEIVGQSTKRDTDGPDDDPNCSDEGSCFYFRGLRYVITKAGRVHVTTNPHIANFNEESSSAIKPGYVYKAYRHLPKVQPLKGGESIHWDFFVVFRLINNDVPNDKGQIKVHRLNMGQRRGFMILDFVHNMIPVTPD
jgi:hypothetical protein